MDAFGCWVWTLVGKRALIGSIKLRKKPQKKADAFIDYFFKLYRDYLLHLVKL